MNREFFINIVFLIFVNLLIKPVYLFGIDRAVQNTVAEGEYGIYFALLNFTMLFQIVNDFGIQSYNNRHIAQNSHLLGKYFPNLLILKSLLGGLYLVMVFIAALIWGYGPAYYHLLLLLGINQVLLSLILFLRSNVSGLALYRTDSLLSVLDKLLLILLCGYLLTALDHFRIEWFVYAQTGSLLLTVAVAFAVVHQRSGRLRLRFQPVFLLAILRQSYPYALAVFLMTAYTRVDGVMIERLLPDGPYEAHIYASAYRLLDAANMIGFLFAGILLPMFARLLKAGEPVAPLVRFSFQLIWAGAVSLVVPTVLFREEIMVLLYTNGSAYSGEVLGLLIVSFLAVSGMYIYGTLLTAHGNMMRMNVIFLAGMLLNIGLNLWLIPHHGARGAAVATCVTQFLVFGAELGLARWQLSLPWAPDVVIRLSAFILLTIAIGFVFRNMLDWYWPLRFLASLAGGLILALLWRLIDLRQLAELLRQRPAPGK